MMTSLSLIELCIVSTLWGITNPYLKQQQQRGDDDDVGIKKDDLFISTFNNNNPSSSVGTLSLNQQCLNYVRNILLSLWLCVKNWKFLLPFILNQCGSIVYMHCLSYIDLSVAVPITSSLNLVISGWAGWYVGEKQQITPVSVIGFVMILIGIVLCVYGKQT